MHTSSGASNGQPGLFRLAAVLGVVSCVGWGAVALLAVLVEGVALVLAVIGTLVVTAIVLAAALSWLQVTIGVGIAAFVAILGFMTSALGILQPQDTDDGGLSDVEVDIPFIESDGECVAPGTGVDAQAQAAIGRVLSEVVEGSAANVCAVYQVVEYEKGLVVPLVWTMPDPETDGFGVVRLPAAIVWATGEAPLFLGPSSWQRYLATADYFRDEDPSPDLYFGGRGYLDGYVQLALETMGWPFQVRHCGSGVVIETKGTPRGRAAITARPDTGFVSIDGRFYPEYLRQDGPSGIGWPRGDGVVTNDGRAIMQTFTHGRLFWVEALDMTLTEQEYFSYRDDPNQVPEERSPAPNLTC
jgi:hypothetical protein